MAWTGTGQYVLNPLFTPEVNGNIVDAVRYNGALTDIAGGISFCLAKNGENVPTANLPMGGYKHTGADAAENPGEYVTFEQVNDLVAAAVAVAANVFTGLTDAPSSYTGQAFKPVRVNAGESGLEFAPLGGIRIVNVSASRNLLATDFGAILVCDSASPIVLTLPPFASLGVPPESSLVAVQWNAGKVSFAPGAGVTISGTGGFLSTRAQFSQITLIKLGNDLALAGGDLGA
jgi:hypothetical protein